MSTEPCYRVVISKKPARRGEAFVVKGDVFILKVYREVPNAAQLAEWLARNMQAAEDKKRAAAEAEKPAATKIAAYNHCQKCGLVGIDDQQFCKEMLADAPVFCAQCGGPAVLSDQHVPGYDGVTPMIPYAGIVCETHGRVDITAEEYEAQLNHPNRPWACPRCGGLAFFDDERFEQLQGVE